MIKKKPKWKIIHEYTTHVTVDRINSETSTHYAVLEKPTPPMVLCYSGNGRVYDTTNTKVGKEILAFVKEELKWKK